MSAKIGDAGYRIIGPIASGGMGEVYKAEHVITRRIEAIKLLSGAGTAEESERFLREIQLQASLSHPNIAAVYNAFRVNDDLVMVMELVEGEPLRAILARARLPLPEAINYACQALRAISYAHAHGVIHRDISPGNIIIAAQGIVKLTDFGLAKTVAPSTVSQSGALMGSPHYMSPEQVIDSTRASARSDIYSLGAVLYEMVTGKKLFEGDSSFTIMQSQVEHRPVPPIEIEPAIPQALNQAILKALEKDPERRFDSADSFRAALEGALAGPAAAASTPPAPAVPRPRPRKTGFAVPYLQAAAICAVLLPVAMIVDSNRRHRAIQPAPPAVEVRQPEAKPEAPPQPVAAEAPPAQTEPPPADSASINPAPRRRARTARAPQRDLSPSVTRQEPIGQLPAAASPRPVATSPVRIPEPPAPASEQPPVNALSVPAVPHADAGIAEPAVAPADPSPAAPADASDGKDKKPHNRVRRALGKILGRFH